MKRRDADRSRGGLSLGPRSTQWLREIGVHDRSDLERLGAVLAYRILKDRFPGVSLNMLYALEGALTGRKWNELTPDEKTRLREEVRAVDIRPDTNLRTRDVSLHFTAEFPIHVTLCAAIPPPCP